MSGQQQEKTRERTPANLGVKFNPNLGAANLGAAIDKSRVLAVNCAEVAVHVRVWERSGGWEAGR